MIYMDIIYKDEIRIDRATDLHYRDIDGFWLFSLELILHQIN